MKMGLDMDQAWAWTLDLKMDQKYGGGVTFTEVDFGHTAEVGIFSEGAFLSCEFSLQNSAVFARFRKKTTRNFRGNANTAKKLVQENCSTVLTCSDIYHIAFFGPLCL
jgi:hypothetical protein